MPRLFSRDHLGRAQEALLLDLGVHDGADRSADRIRHRKPRRSSLLAQCSQRVQGPRN